MRYKPDNVRYSRDTPFGPGYVVTMADGTKEWWRLAWQATARAHGWRPPKDSQVAVIQLPRADVQGF